MSRAAILLEALTDRIDIMTVFQGIRPIMKADSVRDFQDAMKLQRPDSEILGLCILSPYLLAAFAQASKMEPIHPQGTYADRMQGKPPLHEKLNVKNTIIGGLAAVVAGYLGWKNWDSIEGVVEKVGESGLVMGGLALVEVARLAIDYGPAIVQLFQTTAEHAKRHVKRAHQISNEKVRAQLERALQAFNRVRTT